MSGCSNLLVKHCDNTEHRAHRGLQATLPSRAFIRIGHHFKS